jgi:flavin-dependent dehydrogenase
VLDRIAAATPALRQATFSYADQELVIPIKAAHGVDALYAPRRTLLDPVLVDAAAAAGATFRYGLTALDVRRDRRGRVDGVVARDEHGSSLELGARWVVGADGLRSAVARAVDAPVLKRGTGRSGVVYGYWAGLDSDQYEWMFRAGASVGVIPTNDGLTCVFVATNPERVGRGGMDAMQRVLGPAWPRLAERLAAAVPPAGVRSFPGVAGFVRRSYGPGWALVGDAGYWKDPISAHGLTDALRDAELLARALLAAASGTMPEAEALAGYQSTRDRLSADLFSVTDTIARHDWSDEDIPVLLRLLSDSMAAEVSAIAGLDEPATAA